MNLQLPIVCFMKNSSLRHALLFWVSTYQIQLSRLVNKIVNTNVITRINSRLHKFPTCNYSLET